MAKLTTVTVSCDICRTAESIILQDKKLQVIFTTEETEGRNVTPHLTFKDLDICIHCMDLILAGKAVYGAGAQGYNRYWFEQEK